MQIDVFGDEIREDTEAMEMMFKGIAHTGIQLEIGKLPESPDEEDDPTTLTFWFSDEYSQEVLRKVFRKALRILNTDATLEQDFERLIEHVHELQAELSADANWYAELVEVEERLCELAEAYKLRAADV